MDDKAPSGSGRSDSCLDPSYLLTKSGLTKTIASVLSLIGFITVMNVRKEAFGSAGGYYAFVSLFSFLISTLFILFYVFHVVERFKGFPWLLVEMGYTTACCILFFIAGSVAASRLKHDALWEVLTGFGYVAMIVFGCEALMKYLQRKRSDPAQDSKYPSAEETATESNNKSIESDNKAIESNDKDIESNNKTIESNTAIESIDKDIESNNKAIESNTAIESNDKDIESNNKSIESNKE